MAKPLASLVPSIEQRECAWTELQDRLAHPPRPLLLPSITLSREFGCEGYPLALHLKELLESISGLPWTVFDKALVDRVASNEQVSRDLLYHLGNESHAQDVLRAHFGFLTHDDAFAKVVKHLVQIAMAGCAIIVGRGGAVACQDLTNCFHFRLVGGFDFRVRTIARRLEMPLPEAEELVRRQSKLRERFISECLDADITATRWYDAVFNNERQRVESIAQACLRIVESGWAEKIGLKPAAPHVALVSP
jgi:hypothetical protein